MATDRHDIQRSILPIPDIPHVGLTTYDAKDPNTKFAPITPIRPPKGAPNVLVVLLDDVGFGASSAFGGPVNMPTVWWLRPLSSAARVGEHSAVVWKRLYFSPPAASRSALGVAIAPPNALDAPKPTSSSRTTSTFGAPAGGRTCSIGGKDVSGSLASYVVRPMC